MVVEIAVTPAQEHLDEHECRDGTGTIPRGRNPPQLPSTRGPVGDIPDVPRARNYRRVSRVQHGKKELR